MRGTVVLTTSAGSFPGLVERLRAFPVAVDERPLMRFAPPEDWALVDAALDAAFGAAFRTGSTEAEGKYAAIAFTSPRAAQAFADRAKGRGLVSGDREWRGIQIWAAGAGTARALAELTTDVRTPSEHEVGQRGAAGALARALLEAGVRGHVLFPCGDHRRDELPARLRDDGIEVDEVVCYRSLLASEAEAREAAECATVIVVGSPSVADLLARACSSGMRPALLAIGPITAAASRASGWVPAAVAKHPTAEAVSAAVRTILV